MTLNQLRYFQAVCQHNNITKAAATLMVSQPSVSNAIKELEADIGFPLLVRSNNSISLTHEGKAFYEFVSHMLGQLDITVHQLRRRNQQKQTDKGTIFLGVPPIAGSAVLPEILKKIYSAYSDMTVDTFEAHYCRTQQMVLDELIDCTITVENGTQFQGLKYIHLAQLEIRYCVNERNPLSAYEYVTFEQIKDNPVVLFKDTSFHYQLIMKWFRDHGSEPHVVMQSDRPYEIISYLGNFLEAGAFLSYETMYMYKNVIPLKLQNPPYVSVAIAYKKNAPLNKRVRQFLQLFT